MHLAMERLEEQAIDIPAGVREKVTARLSKMQMLPSIAQQALDMVRDPDCTIKEFAKLIEQDLKLATDMLKTANSAIYSRGRPIASLTDATMRLGLQQCRNLIITSCFASLISDVNLEEKWIRELLWRHGLATAVIASNLNRTFRAGLNGEEFTAGLMHDIGRILAAVALPECFLEADPVDFQENRPNALRREQEVWGTTHTELGAWFASQNRLPNCLVSAIRYHHFPQCAPSDQRLVAIVAIADHMANYVQKNETAEGYDPSTNPFVDLLGEFGVQRARQLLEAQAQEILEQSCQDALELCELSA